MASLICKKPIVLQYKFQVGQKFVILYMPFGEGADVLEVIRSFCAKEHIPQYLHGSLLRVTRDIFESSEPSSSDAPAMSRDAALKAWSDEFRYHHAAFSSGDDAISLISTSPILRHSSSSSLSSSSSSSSINLSGGQTDSRYIRAPPADLIFIEKFRQLVEDKSGAETLHHLENSFALAVSQLRENRDIALKNLQAKQQEEMNVAVAANPNSISKLVTKHVEQVQTLDDSFKRDIERLQNLQRTELREFVSKYTFDDFDTTKSVKNSSPVSSPMKATPEETRKGNEGAASKTKKALSSLMATITGDSSNSNSSNTPTSGVSTALSASTASLSSSEKKSVWTESFSVFLGPQIKVVYNVRLTNADVLELCKRKKGLDEWREAARTIYSDSLTGLVMMADPNLMLDTKRAKDLLELSQSSTEFHFESMSSQLATLRSSMSSSDRSSALQTGDFVVTQHSNLNQINAVFHLVLERSAASAVDNNSLTLKSPLLIGLKNLLATAAEYDISTLYIPILLLPEFAEGILLDAPYVKRAEVIARAIKALLSASPSWGDSLRTIYLTLPTTSEPTFSKYHTMLKTVL